MSADEGFCLPAWGTYTHTTNRLHGDALIIAYTIRDPIQPVCMTHYATLSENIIATPAYGSSTGAASPVMKRFILRYPSLFLAKTIATALVSSKC